MKWPGCQGQPLTRRQGTQAREPVMIFITAKGGVVVHTVGDIGKPAVYIRNILPSSELEAGFQPKPMAITENLSDLSAFS